MISGTRVNFLSQFEEYKIANNPELNPYLIEKEEQMLRNFIIWNLRKLEEIYTLYSKFTNPKTKTKPVLVRLFLWQLLRDIEYTVSGVSLVESDLYFANNPNSCVESLHSPFEEIYFWQFLQYLVGCSWLFYQKKCDTSQCTLPGIVVNVFKTFLEQVIFSNYGKFEGKY